METDSWIIVKYTKDGKRKYLCCVIFLYPIDDRFFQWVPEESGVLNASRYSSFDEANYWVQYFREVDKDATYAVRKISIEEWLL